MLKSMDKVKSRISAIVEGIKVGFECEAKIDFGAMYYQVDNEEQLTREFMQFTDEADGVNLYHCKEAMTGEDFGYMLKEIPGFMFWLGVQSDYGLHHSKIIQMKKRLK